MHMAKQGDQVSVTYVGTFDDGTVFDSSEQHGGEPLTFVVGSGQIILGFDAAVLDMEIGDVKDVTIEPADAYGEYNPELLQTERIEDVPDGAELAKHVGQTLYFQNGGEFIQAHIVSAEDGNITVDFNHPMAGKRLNFQITLLEVQEHPGYGQSIPTPGEPPAPGQSA